MLGKPALFVEGVLHPFGGPRKAIALLAYVLLHRDRALSRAAVAELFWPDEEDESARAALRRHLHRALAALPEAAGERPWVIADKVTLRWNPEAPLEIDTATYEFLSGTKDLEAAVALYRGDYLDGFYDEWILPERERLRALHAANLVELIDDRRRARDFPAAIAFAQSLLRLDPLREDALRRLMSIRFASGDRSGALAEFETFRRRLRDELATDPMPETIAVREAIRSNDHVFGAAPVEATRPAHPGFPFTGRSEALETLRDAWRNAARGSASTAIVSGEAGAGKSRLIGELVALAEAQGGRVLFGTVATIETEPYQPVAEALRGALPLLRFEGLPALKLAALSSLVPGVRDFAPNVQPPPQLEPEQDRQRLFDAIESAFDHLAEKRPLLLVLEDLHWAGSATIDLLEFLVRRLRGKSVLVVISFREENVGAGHALRAFLRRLDAQRSSHVALGPLEAADVRALVAGAVSKESARIADDILAASDGNALFVTELLRERLSGVDDAPVPAGIAGTVIVRLNRLSAPARTLAEAAAVAGAGFDGEVVRHVCGWSFADVLDALDELLDGALVRVSPHRRTDYAFSHQLVHAAVYATIDETTRRGLHRRVARTLDQLFPERPSLGATIARHFDAAGFADDAVARYVPAARYALDVFAQGEAVALASRALELCSNAADRFTLHQLREEGAARAGDVATRRLDCNAMIEVAQELGEEELLGNALSRMIAFCRHLSASDDEAVFIAQLRALSDRTASPRWALAAALASADLQISRSNFRAAEAALLEAEALAGPVAGDTLIFEYWYMRAFVGAWIDPHQARTALGFAQSRVAGDRMRAGRALRVEALIAEVEGDARTLRRVATQLLELCVMTGDIEGQATAHRNLANAAWVLFDIAADRIHTGEALNLFERVQKPQAVAAVILHRGVCAQQFGDFAAADADYSEARSIWESLGQFGNACTALANRAFLASFRGDPASARELALEALELAHERRLEREGIYALEALGVAERDLKMFAEARLHLEAALDWRRERDPRTMLEGLIEIVPVYLALGEVGAARTAAGALLEGIDGDRSLVPFPVHALSVAAAAYAASGESERASALRSEAEALLRELAERIDEGPSRAGYLSLPVHRAAAEGRA